MLIKFQWNFLSIKSQKLLKFKNKKSIRFYKLKFYNFSAPTKYQSNTNELTCLTHQKTTLVQHEKLIAYLYNQSVITTGQKKLVLV